MKDIEEIFREQSNEIDKICYSKISDSIEHLFLPQNNIIDNVVYLVTERINLELRDFKPSPLELWIDQFIKERQNGSSGQ